MDAPIVNGFFDEKTNTVSYIVADPNSGNAAIIDPVLDFDPASGRTATTSADALIDYAKRNALKIDWILETHIHADHLTGAAYLQSQVGGQIGIGENVSAVQSTFKKIFNRDDLYTDGRQFDRLFADGEAFSVGNVEAHVLSTPGHTPACVTYVIGDAAFVGDTLFMPDYGTARCDFPDGSAATLFDSIQKIFSLPANTRLFMCHDYKAPGRVEFAWETSVEEQRNQNIHVNDRVARDDFVQMRNRRDAELNLPALILPSIQVNLCAGELPDAEANDIRYLQIPLDTF